jgi:hypothetical protein
MPETPPNSDHNGDTDADTSTPRWVKVVGVIIIVLILLFVILHLTGRSPVDHRSASAGTPNPSGQER